MTGRRPPRWLDDERLVRIVWSRLTEAGDQIARQLRYQYGAVPAMQLVMSHRLPSAAFLTTIKGERNYRLAHDRWLVRLPLCVPQRDLETVVTAGGRVLIPQDPTWPLRLNDLADQTPPCLWVRGTGQLDRLVQHSVAMVGSRASTRYGETVCAELSGDLAEDGVTIVSGAAVGIDAAAHRAALAAGRPTIAVLACGVDRAYPAGHSALLDRITEDGLVVSEVPPGSTPTRYRFLERNRIIAAVTTGTVVVEAAWRSGALNTARLARDLGRPVGVVPGSIHNTTSAGCHKLLRRLEAICVTDASEILELISPIGAVYANEPVARPRAHDGLNSDQLRVWEALPVSAWQTVERLAVTAGLLVHETRDILSDLELAGRAESGKDTEERACWRRPRSSPVPTESSQPGLPGVMDAV